MKKIVFILAILLCLTAASSFTAKSYGSTFNNESSITSASPQGDYCPKGYICEAANCRAKAHAIGRTIDHISIYKNSDGNVIAYVPGYGHLRCYWQQNGERGAWYFDADSTTYEIYGYNRK